MRELAAQIPSIWCWGETGVRMRFDRLVLVAVIVTQAKIRDSGCIIGIVSPQVVEITIFHSIQDL
jgi:hypothetical protein